MSSPSVPVVYSLGNFWFNSKTMDTGIARLTIDQNGEIKLEFIPCIQSGCQTRLVTEESQKQRIINTMQQISEGVIIDAEGTVTRAE